MRAKPIGTITAAMLLAACSTVPRTHAPRRALPMPEDVAARFALTGPVVERSLVHVGDDGGLRFYRGRLDVGAERVDFHFVEKPGCDRQHFVLALPILAGGRELMWWVATDLAERGYAVAFPERVSSALREGQRGPAMEELFRRSVVHARALLAWARAPEGLGSPRQGLIGLSLGSMIGSAVLACEPDVRGALCLAGGDLPDMLMRSNEPRVLRWLRWRTGDDGMPRSEITRELDRCLRSDPALLGGYVDTDRVLLVSATLDDVVPTRHQDLLWESLGRPERILVPLGHYTAVLALDPILGSVSEFLTRSGV